MAKKQKSSRIKLLFVPLVLLALVFFLLTKQNINSNHLKPAITPTISFEQSLLIDAAVWYPSAPWTQPKETSESTLYGVLDGDEITAKITSNKAMIDHFEIVPTLEKYGFQPDSDLSADGPGSSQWGYKKTEANMSSVLIFSYETTPTASSPNTPLEFNCPCEINVKVFSSKEFDEKIDN